MAPTAGTPRILVKAPNWVGDCVMATPAIEFLRRTFPEAQIDAVARRGAAGVLLDNPHLSSVIVADERKLDPEIRRRLAAQRYDAAAILPNSFGSAWMAWRLGIRRRIGFARGGRSLLLSHRISYEPYEWQTPTPKALTRKCIAPRDGPAAGLPRHMVHYYLRVAVHTAQALGAAVAAPDDDSAVALHLPVNADSAGHVSELLAKHRLNTHPLLVGINPGAAYGGAKRWAPELLAEVADALVETHDARIICTASPGESNLTDEVQAHASSTIYRLGEEVDLRGLTALIARLAVLVTNDSGAMHVAAALGTPIVAVFGPTDWNVTKPWSRRARVLRDSPECAPCFLRECPIDHRCMTGVAPGASVESELVAARDGGAPANAPIRGVTPGEVLAAIQRLLRDVEADDDH